MKTDAALYRLALMRCVGQIEYNWNRFGQAARGKCQLRMDASSPRLVSALRQLERFVNLLFPTDIHSILRYETVICRKLIDNLLKERRKLTVTDVGGSVNFSLLFLSLFAHDVERYNLIVYEKGEAELARRQIRRCGYGSTVAVMNGDANTFSSITHGSSDIIFMVDVLEHVPDDTGAVGEAWKNLKNGGLLCLSVPTPSYPRYFGKGFHRLVGHLRDGYDSGDLDRLCSRLRKVSSRPYVNRVNSSVVGLFYRILPRHLLLCGALYIATYWWLRYIAVCVDVLVRTRVNSSLFAVYRKDAAMESGIRRRLA